MALGAEKSDIIRMILKRSLLLAAVGVALGVAGALAVTRVLAKFLFEVTPTDLPTFLGVAALLVAVALLSGLLPARRATRGGSPYRFAVGIVLTQPKAVPVRAGSRPNGETIKIE
jgi:predicted lysophospholipase L1 biosynthesis ABC-type transport system permease subunit